MASSRDTFTFAEECKVAKVGCPNVFLVMLEYRMIRTRQFLCHIRHRDPLPEWGAYTPCRTSVYVSRCGVSRATQCGPGALIFSTTSWRVGKISWMYKVRAEALTGRPFYQKGCRQHRGYIMGAELCQVAKRNCATHIGRCRNAMAKRWYATSYCHDPFSSAYCRDARLYIP